MSRPFIRTGAMLIAAVVRSYLQRFPPASCRRSDLHAGKHVGQVAAIAARPSIRAGKAIPTQTRPLFQPSRSPASARGTVPVPQRSLRPIALKLACDRAQRLTTAKHDSLWCFTRRREK
jgi:hypothetical protein